MTKPRRIVTQAYDFSVQDIVNKLVTFKYFNEKTENCISNLKNVDFNNRIDNKVKFGTCLVTYDLKTNFKADVLVDNMNHEVLLVLHDAGELTNNTNFEIHLPDPEEEKRKENKKLAFENIKKHYNENLINLIYEQPRFFQNIISYGFPFTINELSKSASILPS